MAQRMVVFDAESVLRLLTHYSDAEVPLDATLKWAGASEFIQQWIGLGVESKEWENENDLHIRYEGNKVLALDMAPARREESNQWVGGVEAPRLQ